MRDRYITATLELLREHHEVAVVVRGLREVLVSRDHERLLEAILRGVLRHLEDGSSGAMPMVMVASEGDTVKYQAVIADLLSRLKAPVTPEVTIDRTLIGGVVVSSNYERIDTSYKRVLQALYEKVTV